MNKMELLESAKAVHVPSSAAVAEFRSKRDLLAVKVTERLLQRKDLERLVGPNNQQMMEDNHRNHARFMESLFCLYSAETFVETVLWVYRAYRTHGFQLAYWPAQLNAWVEVFRQELSEQAFEEIYPLYHWLIVQQPVFARLSGETDSTSGKTVPEH